MRIIILSLGFALAFGACKQAQSAGKVEQEKTMDYAAEGYKEATVVDLKGKDGCGILLQLTGSDRLLSPVEWDAKYQVVGSSVWVKYRGSRIPQKTCTSSQPIIVEGIALRN